MNIMIYLSELFRNLVRSMKKTEIRMLQFTKFTAAIDVGIWSNNKNFEDHKSYTDNSNVLVRDAKLIFNHHETNLLHYLESDLLSEVFTSLALKEDENINLHSEVIPKWKINKDTLDLIESFKFHLKDIMITFPTILIILNRKEEALYYLEN